MRKVISLLLALSFVLILAGCSAGKPGSNGKELLRIQRFSEEDEDNTNLIEPETRQISIAYDTLPEMPVQKYDENDDLKAFTDFIKDELGITIDEHWTVLTHFYDSDMTVGMLKFQYWIGNISTNKTILFNLDNGKADMVLYSMLNESTDENGLLERVRLFEERYEQEKRELKKGEVFVSEDVTYSYYYDTGNLVYTYTLFFSYGEDGVINNEYGTECYIDENGCALAMK